MKIIKLYNKIKKKIFEYFFHDEIEEIKEKIKEINNIQDKQNRYLSDIKMTMEDVNSIYHKTTVLLDMTDISIDVSTNQHRSNSWAVISIQGEKRDFIKFIDMGDKDIRDISYFLRRYERDIHIKVDSPPQLYNILMPIKNKKFK